MTVNAFLAGTLVLLPESTTVKTFLPHQRPDEGAGVEVKISPCSTDLFYLTPFAGNDSVAPLWCLATTEDVSKANMVWVNACINTICGVDFAGPVCPVLKKRATRKFRKTTSEEAAIDDEDVSMQDIIILVLLNVRDVFAGSELVVYRKKPETKKKEQEAITVTALAKRARQ